MSKVIFVDFDDTLCLHRKEVRTEQAVWLGKEEGCKVAYGGSEPNHKVIQFVEQEKKKGARVVLLSSANSKMLQLKECWCEKHCGGLIDEFVGSSIDLTKTQVMQAYAEKEGLDPGEIVFIDDRLAERLEAEKAGITVFSPQLIQNREE